MINRVILTGRLTSDVELRKTNDGISFTYFTIAVNRTTGNNQTDFISCVAWRGTAELMERYLKKGSLIGVEGRIEVYRTEQNGEYQTRTNVNVTNVQFLESRSDAERRNENTQSNTNNDLSFENSDEVNEKSSKFEESNDSKEEKDIDIDSIDFSEIKF